MTRLLIIADDLTGALDTGVQFSKQGILSKTICDYKEFNPKKDKETAITVVNSESRHCDPKTAYDRVFEICEKAMDAGFQYFYKKTDSGLRGNLGSELAAVIDATGYEKLYFIPCYPEMDRKTIGGIQYWKGRPIHETEFGKDSLNPVTTSDVEELIHQQTQILTHNCKAEDLYSLAHFKGKYIHVIDGECKEELQDIADKLKGLKPNILAGCAGFASYLTKLISLEKKESCDEIKIDNLLILSGSIHAVTKKQIEYAKHHGILEINLKPEWKLSNPSMISKQNQEQVKEWMDLMKKSHILLIDSQDQAEDESITFCRKQGMDPKQIPLLIAANLASIAKEFTEKCPGLTLFVVGGDTLAAVIKEFHCKEIIPKNEIAEGTVLSDLIMENGIYLPLISKSGGFGEEDLFKKISQRYLTCS